MNFFKQISKRVLTVFMAVLMLMSCVIAVDKAEEKEYDSSVNYMEQMIVAAIKGNQADLEEAARLRNLKIAGENMDYEPVSSQELIDTFEERVGFSLSTNYMSKMRAAYFSGDYNAGCEAARKRNIKISYLGLNYMRYSYDELILLSKVICCEAGSSWLPIEWKMAVGEVILNRVAHPAFPNSIYDVVYQRGQCAGTGSYSRLSPSAACVDAVISLMNGHRIFNDTNVVFQANFCQGHGVARSFYDSHFGYTYFCYY